MVAKIPHNATLEQVLRVLRQEIARDPQATIDLKMALEAVKTKEEADDFVVRRVTNPAIQTRIKIEFDAIEAYNAAHKANNTVQDFMKPFTDLLARIAHISLSFRRVGQTAEGLDIFEVTAADEKEQQIFEEAADALHEVLTERAAVPASPITVVTKNDQAPSREFTTGISDRSARIMFPRPRSSREEGLMVTMALLVSLGDMQSTRQKGVTFFISQSIVEVCTRSFTAAGLSQAVTRQCPQPGFGRRKTETPDDGYNPDIIEIEGRGDPNNSIPTTYRRG